MTWIPPFTPDPRLYPFDSHWWDADVPGADYSGRVHYIDEGEGPPILFLHGNPTWSFLYRGIVIRLRSRFRCIALDLPGFGLSEGPRGEALRPADHAEVVRGLIRHLDLKNLIIMGQDWGGPIGLRAACDESARLRGLVMGNTFYWPLDGLRHRAFSYAMSTGPAQKAIVHENMFVEKIMPKAVLHPMDPSVLDQYREAAPSPTRRHGAAKLPRELIRSGGWLQDLSADVPRLLGNVPLLLTWGTKDFAFPPTMLDRFRDDFRLVRVSRLDAKHFIQEDAPAEIAESITRWAREIG